MTLLKHAGSCHCGNASFTAWLPAPLDTYHPRACDCDFCCMHGAAYLSDPKGKLELVIRDANAISHYKQGGELAVFWVCKRCGVLMAVSYEEDGVVYAALNSKTLPQAMFAVSQSVSPKLLSNAEKVTRWKTAWFANVTIVSN